MTTPSTSPTRPPRRPSRTRRGRRSDAGRAARERQVRPRGPYARAEAAAITHDAALAIRTAGLSTTASIAFSGRTVELLVSASGQADGSLRIDGWVTPTGRHRGHAGAVGPSIDRAVPVARVQADDLGRFVLSSVPERRRCSSSASPTRTRPRRSRPSSDSDSACHRWNPLEDCVERRCGRTTAGVTGRQRRPIDACCGNSTVTTPPQV